MTNIEALRADLINICANEFLNSADPDGGWSTCIGEATEFVNDCTDFEVKEQFRAIDDGLSIHFNPDLYTFVLIGDL